MIGYLRQLFRMFVLLGLIPQAPGPQSDALTWLEARTARRLLEPAVWLVRVDNPGEAHTREGRDTIWHPVFALYPRGGGWWGIKMNGAPLVFEGLYIPYRGRLVHFPVLFSYGSRPVRPSAFPLALEEFQRE